MIIDERFAVKGRYKLIRRAPDLSVRYESEWIENLVTDYGVRCLLGGALVTGSTVAFPVAAVCGSGNTPPALTDTQLDSFVAGTNTVHSFSTERNTASAPYYIRHNKTWRFAAGVAAGNISELGVANSTVVPTSANSLFSRALVKDASGNPSTITVLSDEFLDVVYELTIYAPAESTGTFNQMIDGSPTSFAYTIKPANMAVTSNSGWSNAAETSLPTIFGNVNSSANISQSALYPSTSSLGPISGLPTGVASGITGVNNPVGNYAGKYRDITWTAGLNDANISFGVYRLAYNLGCMQMQISPAITKTATKVYSITMRITVDNTI